MLELLSQGETEDDIAAALGATGEDVGRRVHRVKLAVLALVSATPSQPEAGGVEGEPERALPASLEVVHGDEEMLMAVYGEAARLFITEYRTALEPIVASFGPRTVAELLEIDDADVAQLVVEGQLYAFSSGSSLRFPTWQLVEGDRADHRTAPGLTGLVAAIPRSMRPASVLGFMHTPQDDLRVHGDRVTPLQWLKDGGDVQDVLDILTERDRS